MFRAAGERRACALQWRAYNMGPLTEDLRQFLAGPVSIAVATQDGALHPDCTRALAIRPGPGPNQVTVWLPTPIAERACSNLGRDPRIAVGASRPTTHQTFQLKGRAVRVAPGGDDARAIIDGCFEAFTQEALQVGMPRRLLDRVVRWPVVEVEVEVEDVFDQTPGPGAGGRVAV
jgi:hypothetical protein